MTTSSEQIVLDVEETNELLFKVKVEGTDPSPARVRLVCEGQDGVSYMFNGKPGQDDLVQFVIPSMSGKIKEGLYAGSVEVLVENRCFVPVQFNINFKKTVKVMAEVFKPQLPPPPKVTVTAAPIVVKKPQQVSEAREQAPNREPVKQVKEILAKDNPTDAEIREWAKTIVNASNRDRKK